MTHTQIAVHLANHTRDDRGFTAAELSYEARLLSLYTAIQAAKELGTFEQEKARFAEMARELRATRPAISQ